MAVGMEYFISRDVLFFFFFSCLQKFLSFGEEEYITLPK